MPLDRESAEHLADDTGLNPSQLDPHGTEAAGDGPDDRAEHLARDAGIGEEELSPET